ncbi:MAG: thioesterase family protein [Candidatus Neomarinimicrobiota bacterium]
MTIKLFSRKDFDYWTTIYTNWGDMDGLRHINHASYLTYMETARLDLYMRIGHKMERWDQINSSILASMKVNYIDQAVHPSTFEIGQRITRIGLKSYDILTAIFQKGTEKPILQANFILVSMNYKTGKTIPVPDEIKKCLNPF